MRMLLFEVTYLQTVLHTLASKRRAKAVTSSRFNGVESAGLNNGEVMATVKREMETENGTMRAAMVTEFNAPLTFATNIPIPACPSNRILVRITACSLCMSDVGASMGEVPGSLPFCAGHEPVGTISVLGSAVTGFALGDRVGFMPASSTCNACSHCLAGEHRFCAQVKNVGFDGLYGGFSEYCIADPNSTVRIPDGVRDEEAAPLLCAGITAYGALLKAQQAGGTLINIIGCGGVGHLAIMYAKAMGFRVHAYDISPSKIALALRCGADKALSSIPPTSSDPSTAFQQAKSTLVISGASAAYDLAFQITEKRGRIIAVGVPGKKIEVDVLSMVLKGHELIASQQGSRADLMECLELAAQHGIKPVYEVRDMLTLNDGFKEMLEGKVDGRLVYKWDADVSAKVGQVEQL